jgi:acetyltransferase-like isoleucine patch superfamily enzyme
MVESDLIPFSNRAYKTNLKIGDMVSVGTHAIIMPGVREIGENSIVSAGSVVTRPVPSNVIVAGNPATVVRKIPSIVNRTKH